MKDLFSLNGKHSDFTLLTSSIPHFCRSAGCHATDFLHGSTSHASDRGLALFADLIIWQLIKSFDEVLHIFCKAPENRVPIDMTLYSHDGNVSISDITDVHLLQAIQKWNTTLQEKIKDSQQENKA